MIDTSKRTAENPILHPITHRTEMAAHMTTHVFHIALAQRKSGTVHHLLHGLLAESFGLCVSHNPCAWESTSSLPPWRLN